jgi:hypothetical protein
MGSKIGSIDRDLGRVTEQALDLPNHVVDKLYANLGKVGGDEALAALDNLLKSGEVHPTSLRPGKPSRVAIVGDWGKTGDKLVAAIEMSKSGHSAEIASIQRMKERTYTNRLLKIGKLSAGPAAVLLLDDNESE